MPVEMQPFASKGLSEKNVDEGIQRMQRIVDFEPCCQLRFLLVFGDNVCDNFKLCVELRTAGIV